MEFQKIENLKSTTFSNNRFENNNDFTFDLGELNASKTFYFSIMNTGESDIFNIHLSTDKDHFDIFPNFIPILSPSNGNNIGINQIFELQIVHGKYINSNTFYGNLPIGNNK